MKRALAVAVCTFGFAGMACGQDLATVYNDALESDPQIREADANRRAAREARPQAWANLLPQIAGSGSRVETKSDGFQEIAQEVGGAVQVFRREGESEPETTRWAIDLRQNLFSWENWALLRRSSSEVAQAEADYQAAQQDLMVRVAERYFAVLAERDNLEAQQAALDATSRQLEQAEKRFDVGLIAITDVQEAKAARDTGSAGVIATKRSLATAEELLREFTGKKYERLAKPREEMPLRSPDPQNAEQWVELSMNQNLALISSRLAADIARADVQTAFSGHLPVIDFIATKGHFEEESQQVFPGDITVPLQSELDDDTIGIQISLPIFSGGRTQSLVRQSQFRWIAARERHERVSRETERLARDSYLGVISEIARVQALRQALESSQTALKATEAGYEVGTRTAVDVLDARRTLVQAQTNYARSRYDYILNVIRLRQAAGNLDAATIEEINQWLAATAPPAAPPAGQAPPPQQQQQQTPPPRQ
jgi:outer membrane protein